MPYVRRAFGAVVLLLSTAAVAADWKVANLALGPDNRGVTFVDAASLQTKRGKIRFRSEQYFDTAEAGYNRTSALSEVDCASLSLTVIREGFYLGRVPVGFKPIPRTSSHYSSGSSAHWTLRRICEGEYLSGPVEDQGRHTARLFAVEWSPVPGRLSVAMPVSTGRPSGIQVALAVGAGAPANAQPR